MLPAIILLLKLIIAVFVALKLGLVALAGIFGGALWRGLRLQRQSHRGADKGLRSRSGADRGKSANRPRFASFRGRGATL